MTKRKENLTAKTIASASAEEKRYEIYDTVRKGLILRVTTKGYKAFAFRYWYNNSSHQRTIGSTDDYTLAEARKIASEWRKMLDDGKDPIAEKQQNKEAITLAEYIEIFKNDYLKRKLKPSTQKTYASRLNKALKDPISKLSLIEIDRPDVRKFLKAEAKNHPTNANRLHSILSKLFNEAIEDGYIESNPMKGMKKLTSEAQRDVRYTDDDIRVIWEAICTEWEPMQSLLKMLLITGQRLGETSKMKWSDIHNRTWHIPQEDTKNKKPHSIPLPNKALNLLKEMQAINGDSEYVFASQRDKAVPLSHFGNVIQRIRKKTMLNDFRIHDLRHIVATQMISELHIEFIVVGMILNHKGLSASNAITSRYINTDLTGRKEQALQQWAGRLTELTSSLTLKKHA